MNHVPRNIVMWLKSDEDHAVSNFQNRKSVAYHKFFTKISERNIFRLAYDFDSYQGEGIFSNVASYKDGKFIKSQNSFKAEVIYQFNRLAPVGFNPGSAIITNTPEFRNFCSPKINTYNYMPRFFPKTFLVNNRQELISKSSEIRTNKVVVKPNQGQNGDDVFIFDKDSVDLQVISEDKLSDYGFLIQEFIDTVQGIKGLTPSYHDLRIVTHGNNISLCHVRQPLGGSLIGNSHKGALINEIDIEAIPGFIMDFYKQVHAEIIKKYPLPLYSMDIGVGFDGPRLIELNSHTAFPGDNFRCLDRFIDNLINHLETIK